MSWVDVIKPQLSDHLPLLNSVGTHRLSILSWNILMKCAIYTFGPNNGFNIVENAKQYEARLRQTAAVLSRYFATPTFAGIAALQECPPAFEQQTTFVKLIGHLSGANLNYSSLQITKNVANLTIWDTTRWRQQAACPASPQEGPLQRALPTVLECLASGPAMRLGLWNVHLAWLADPGSDAYAAHCTSLAPQLAASLQQLDASVAIALGDWNLDVADLPTEGLTAMRVEHCSQSWKEGAPRHETVDGIVSLL